MFNKCLNSDYEGEIHHLFKLRDMNYKKTHKGHKQILFLDAAVNQLKAFFFHLHIWQTLFITKRDCKGFKSFLICSKGHANTWPDWKLKLESSAPTDIEMA